MGIGRFRKGVSKIDPASTIFFNNAEHHHWDTKGTNECGKNKENAGTGNEQPPMAYEHDDGSAR